jgi:hypothetical protein
VLLLLAFLVVVASNGTYLASTAVFVRRLGKNAGTINGRRVEGSIFSRSDRSLLLKVYLTGGAVIPDTDETRSAILRARCLMIVSLIAFAAFIYLLQATPPAR